MLMYCKERGNIMAKQRNLKYQFKNVIDNSFREGMDKHSMKAMGKDNSKIYSYSDRKNLIDLSANFSNYMKEVHPEVKFLKDINSNHIQEFLNSKIEECSQSTLNQYQSHFRKLEVLTNNTYRTEVDFHSAITPISMKNGGGKIRNVMCTDSQYNQLLKTTNQNLKNALILAKNFGCRASECSKMKYSDLKENGVMIVDSKGKRSRFVEVENEQQRKVLEQLREQGKQGRICPIQTKSLEQAFNRECKRQSIKFQNGAFHTLRKNYATSKYKEYRVKGMTVQQALNRVSGNLGHSDKGNRNDLMKEYICCPIV